MANLETDGTPAPGRVGGADRTLAPAQSRRFARRAERARGALYRGGTVFQQRVWEALRAIPAGETASYREIAGRIGSAQAVRAVARACASNVIAVAVPCHRVVRSDGGLSGYRWGVERKQALLEREGAS